MRWAKMRLRPMMWRTFWQAAIRALAQAGEACGSGPPRPVVRGLCARHGSRAQAAVWAWADGAGPNSPVLAVGAGAPLGPGYVAWVAQTLHIAPTRLVVLHAPHPQDVAPLLAAAQNMPGVGLVVFEPGLGGVACALLERRLALAAATPAPWPHYLILPGFQFCPQGQACAGQFAYFR